MQCLRVQHKVVLTIFIFAAAAPILAQTASVHGRVLDPSGAVVPHATITLTDSAGATTTETANGDGSFSVATIAPGEYNIIASASNLEQEKPLHISLHPGPNSIRLQLRIAAIRQQTTVQEAGQGISTDAASNASALVLQGKALESLGNSSEDLSTDLQALAGPSAGPGGGTVFIDGFSGGQLPSKDAIREIRINQNPFSPEYDKLGYGRVEILTKPGADKYHGDAYYNFGDSVWNSRNPYAAEKAPFLLKEYGASVEGPLRKRASFFLTVDRAAIDNGAIINGTTLDEHSLTVVDPFTQVFKIPQRRIRVSPRLDFQLTPSDTFSMRYAFSDADIRHSGVGGFNLASTGIHNSGTDQTAQLVNTLVISPSLLNETRFQFHRADIRSVSEDPSPQLDVLNSFTGGGAQVGTSRNALTNYEFQNYTTYSRPAHTIRFGVRVRASVLGNISPINFGGTFTIGGRTAPALDAADNMIVDGSGNPVLVNIDSIEAYRRTLLFQREGLSPAQIRVLGGGASQFSISVGNPSISIHQEDVGAFIGDDWRMRPNLTVNLGLRYEWQTNLHDFRDVAPRVGLAWALGGTNPKTVIRAGFGFFYQRFDLINLLTATRYDGVAQRQYVVNNPDFFPTVPDIPSLTGSQQTIEKLSPRLRAPYLVNSAIALERQLPSHTTAALTYVRSHGVQQFFTNDINAPFPGSYNPEIPGSGIYPSGRPGAIFEVMSAGRYYQNELIANITSTVNDAFSLFASYAFNRAESDTDYSPMPQNQNFNPSISGTGLGVGTFPANPYSLAGEYGPASTDIRHQLNVGGALSLKWGLRLNPLFIVDSGSPFNITVGRDLYGNTLFNGRPGLAADSSRPALVPTRYGLLDPNPVAGEFVLPRNFGRGPDIVMFNLRISKGFTFGRSREAFIATTSGNQAGGSPFSTSSASSKAKVGRYNLTISISIRNILNRNNPGPIIGNIASPLFGTANQPYGAASVGGTGFSESANNRRLELQTRFTF